jgi:hypothetical protein
MKLIRLRQMDYKKAQKAKQHQTKMKQHKIKKEIKAAK